MMSSRPMPVKPGAIISISPPQKADRSPRLRRPSR